MQYLIKIQLKWYHSFFFEYLLLYWNRCFIFQLKGDKLDADAVILQAQEMIQYAKSQGKKVDENKTKSAMKDCGNKSKYLHIIKLLLHFNGFF
jgi:hypothetical protein